MLKKSVLFRKILFPNRTHSFSKIIIHFELFSQPFFCILQTLQQLLRSVLYRVKLLLLLPDRQGMPEQFRKVRRLEQQMKECSARLHLQHHHKQDLQQHLELSCVSSKEREVPEGRMCHRIQTMR